MKKLLILLVLVCIEKAMHAQTRPPYIYTIKADSVLITNSCDTAELILENHTQNVPGFLFNKGRGRTEFRRIIKLNDSTLVFGNDTMVVPGNTIANNGLSITNKQIQLGQLVAASGSPAALNNNREIPLNSHNLLFTGSGELGIGTTSPNAKLTVVGSSAGNQNLISLQPTDDSVNANKLLFSRVSDNWTPVSIGQLYANPANFGGVLTFYTHPNNGIAGDQFSPVERMRITSEGNVGIGANNPTTKLYVNGSSYFNGTQQITGTGSGPDNFGFTNFNPSVTSTGSDWDHLYGMHITPTLNASGNNQYLYPVSIDPIFNLNGKAQYSDAISAALHVSSVLGGIRIDQSASYTGNTGQPLDIEQRGSANKECIRNYREYVPSTLPFIWNHENRTEGNRNAIVSALRSTILNPKAGGGISFGLDRYYWGTEASIEMKYETYPAGDTLNTVNTSIAFRTETAGVAQTPLYLNGGNTGIGTSTPTAQLHTTGTVRFAGLTNDSTQARVIVCDANGNLYYRSASSLALNDVHNSDLAVNGTLSAQKMRITQTGPWPDYVFSNQYELPTLLQLEQYIKQNNHLPDVPSAAEVEKKGIDVGNNQATLLRKIEELTLYVIEQNKKLQQQNEEISTLKKQNATLDDLKQQVAELKALISNKQ